MAKDNFLGTDVAAIIAAWAPRSLGARSDVRNWDDAAAKWDKKPVPSWSDDPFLRFLEEEIAFTPDMTVLDIGCGSGVYARAIAPRVAHVTGTDISPKMIESAQRHTAEEGLANVDFVVGDFADIAFDQKFDLVIAHMTPAVRDGATFSKMVNASARYVYLAKPCRRYEPVLHTLKEIAGVPTDEGLDDDMLRMLCITWLQGKSPSLRHRSETWHNTRTLGEARTFYLERTLAEMASPEGLEKARVYLESLAVDGSIDEETITEIFMMGWEV